jgi:hypothetical protein
MTIGCAGVSESEQYELQRKVSDVKMIHTGGRQNTAAAVYVPV